MPRHWASWWSGNYADEGCTKPPFKVWVSSYRDRDKDPDNERDECSMCAVIDAVDDIEVINLIKKHYPDYELRFIDAKSDEWKPPRGRFP